MSDRPVLAHDCVRLLTRTVETWAVLPKCRTCDALDSAWQMGWDAGKASGKFIARSDARQERTEQLTTAARIVILLVILGFLIDIVNHRNVVAEEVAE